MPPAAMFPPTGRYDDLMVLLARAEQARARADLPHKPMSLRRWVEPPFNAFGGLVAAAAGALPASLVARLQDRLFHALAGGRKTFPFAAECEEIRRAAALAREAGEGKGRPAAVLCLTSHPPVDPELLYLNVELMRHALWALGAVRGRPCKPRLVIAMDYFALDMLPAYQEAAYAGFTGLYHLGFDRLAHARPGLSRAMLGGAGWPRMIWRMLRFLRRGGESGMVLGGGVPATSRIYYCLREFLGRLYRDRPEPRPGRRILESVPGLPEFLAGGAVGPALARSARRAMEAWVFSRLLAPAELAQVDAGILPEPGRAALRDCARALGWSDPEPLLREFESEFRRETPFRERFFRVLAGRVVARGTPLVVLPLTYGRAGNIAMRYGEPVCLSGYSGGPDGGRLRVRKAGASEEEEIGLADFVRGFVRERFP